MKKTLKSIVALLNLMLFVSFSTQAQWAFSVQNIYNTTTSGVLNTTGKIGIGVVPLIQTLDINGGINVRKGVIQRGGSMITTTADLGLYSLDPNIHMRFVTNQAPFRFFSDGNVNPIGNTELFTIGANGRVGVGSTYPSQKLQVDGGNVLIRGTNNFANGTDVATLYLGDDNHFIRTKRGTGVSINSYTYTGQTGQPETLGIFLQEGTANVGIGTDLVSNSYNGTTNYYKLSVHGPIRATAVVVETGWADFVFEKNYKLRPLTEVEKYIQEKGHLPNIPSAQEMEKKGGADVGELLKLQMQKIEELTLYIIEQNKRIEGLEHKINNSKK